MKQPNIVLVVVDCGRASEFPGGSTPVEGLTNLDQLRTLSLTFPDALTTSPWTLPSCASIVTGLYPWQHGLHAKGSQFLAPGARLLSTELHKLGYRCAFLSANPHLSPDTGLTQSCELTRAGSWLDTWTRIAPRAAKDTVQQSQVVPRNNGSGLVYGRLHPLFQRSERHLLRYPLPWQVSSMILRKIRSGGPDIAIEAPWIEPQLEAYLTQVPSQSPVYCFVNLLDAHEPYPAVLAAHRSWRAWLRQSRIPQDPYSVFQGHWKPSKEQLEGLRQLYRETVQSIDKRIGNIVSILKQKNRWDDTIFVLTADHGQSFGEAGFLFHTLELSDSILRVPLWVRFPDGRMAGSVGHGQASVVDIVPTLFKETGVNIEETLPGRNLAELRDVERELPVFAMSDGLVHSSRARVLRRTLSADEVNEIDQVRVTGCDRVWKVVMNVRTGEYSVHRVESKLQAGNPIQPGANGALHGLIDATRAVGNQVNLSDATTHVVNLSRLQSWGYS